MATLLAGLLLAFINGRRAVPNEVHTELTTVDIRGQIH
jgi:hypothetical protein